MNQITIDKNILLVELTSLGDQFKNIRVMPADDKWTVPYLKYSYRSIYHTERFERDFYCAEEDPIEVPGNWQFIGTTDAITEEIAMKIVEKIRTIAFMKPFKNYLFPDGPDYYWNVLLSYQSWLRTNKIPSDKRFAILKQAV